jgi:16S rRNA C967 or C1407 C5-methylase (RsmB/RsmF family)
MSRVENLSKFQYKILCHALDYDANVKYVSYSTCSIYKEEDENVVKDILQKYGKTWRVVKNLTEIV